LGVFLFFQGETVQVARPIAQSQIQTMSLEQKLELIRKEGIALVDEVLSSYLLSCAIVTQAPNSAAVKSQL